VEHGFHWQGIARHFLSSEERHTILEHPLESQVEAFFRCWTRREAYCKALGTGLDSLCRDCCSTDRFMDEQGRPWTLQSIMRFSGCAAAVCVNSDGIKLTYFDWEIPSSVNVIH
jgi:4'-phosphopantetheinyl transferase